MEAVLERADHMDDEIHAHMTCEEKCEDVALSVLVEAAHAVVASSSGPSGAPRAPADEV